MNAPPPLRCLRCGAQNDPFASVCHACGARNAFGQSAYEEPVSPPPVGRTPMSASSIARWGVAIAGVAIGARVLLLCVRLSARHDPTFVQPFTMPTFTPTANPSALAIAAKLPPARSFALTDDGRALAFDGDELQAYNRGGVVSDVTEASGEFAPHTDSPIFIVDQCAYWIAADETAVVGVRVVPGKKPSTLVKHAQAIGALGADDKAIWFTASDGKSGRKLMRIDVTATKPTPTQVATWSSVRATEPLVVTDATVFVVQSAAAAQRIAAVTKTDGHPTILVTLPAQEEVGALAATVDTLYFTSGAPNDTPHDLYRVPIAGGDRVKMLSSPGGFSDVVVMDKDVVVGDRPNTAWEVDSLPGGDIAQISIVASDVGRPPRLRTSPNRVAWSTSAGVSFADL